MGALLRGELGWILICVVFWAIVLWMESVNEKGNEK